MFTQDDVGRPKVEALADMLHRINPEIDNDLTLVPKGYAGQKLSGYVMLCVDNIDTRSRVIATANKSNTFVKGMFDFRTGLTDAQHYAADWKDMKMVQGFLNSMAFTHEEAKASTPVSACNVTLSVCPTVRAIVALGVANFINFVKGGPLKKIISIDAFSPLLEAF